MTSSSLLSRSRRRSICVASVRPRSRRAADPPGCPGPATGRRRGSPERRPRGRAEDRAGTTDRRTRRRERPRREADPSLREAASERRRREWRHCGTPRVGCRTDLRDAASGRTRPSVRLRRRAPGALRRAAPLGPRDRERSRSGGPSRTRCDWRGSRTPASDVPRRLGLHRGRRRDRADRSAVSPPRAG